MDNQVASVTIVATPTRAARGATVDIDPDSPVDLTAGEKTSITITVTAEDGTTTDEHMVYVYRKRVESSEDATLSALSLSDGDLSPTFGSDRMEYDARVGSDVDKVTVFYTPADNAGGAMVAVTKATVEDAAIACPTIGVGDEVGLGDRGTEIIINVCVTPEAGDGADNIENYAITVYRERRNLETDATLSASGFSIMDASGAPIDVGSEGTCAAAAGEVPITCNLRDDANPDVGYRVRTVTVVATPTDSAGGAVATITAPPDKDPTTADHEIELTAGAETVITVVVQAEDPAAPTQTYTAKCVPPESDSVRRCHAV